MTTLRTNYILLDTITFFEIENAIIYFIYFKAKFADKYYIFHKSVKLLINMYAIFQARYFEIMIIIVRILKSNNIIFHCRFMTTKEIRF